MKIIRVEHKKVLAGWKDYGYPKDTPKNSTPDLYSYWKYLRNSNIKLTLYHGTDTTLLKGIQESGWLKSPDLLSKYVNYSQMNFEGLGTQQRDWGLDKLFFTPSIKYSKFYARQTSKQHGGNPVILEVALPLWQFDEIRGVIFGQKVHNETGIEKEIEKVIKSSKSNEEKTNEILEISSSWSGFRTESELTTKGVLDLKNVRVLREEDVHDLMVKQTIEYIKNGDIEFDYLIHDMDVERIVKENPELLPLTVRLAIRELQDKSYQFEDSGDVEDNNALIWIDNFEDAIPRFILMDQAYRKASDTFYNNFKFLVEEMRDDDLIEFIPERFL